MIGDTIPFFTPGGFGDALNTLEQTGFFTYILPFLLIFALIFGILSRIGLFKENKAIIAIIAIAVSLMSLQFGFVSDFFSQIFPRVGVALSIILAILILVGLFTDPKKPWIMYVLLGVSAVIVVVIVIQSSGDTGMAVGQWLQQNWGNTLGAVVILGGVIAAIAAITSSGRQKKEHEYRSVLFYPPEQK